MRVRVGRTRVATIHVKRILLTVALAAAVGWAAGWLGGRQAALAVEEEGWGPQTNVYVSAEEVWGMNGGPGFLRQVEPDCSSWTGPSNTPMQTFPR